VGGGGGTAASPQITMEIHISDWTHKFQNKTGLDAKTNSELYKSNQVCSVVKLYSSRYRTSELGSQFQTQYFKYSHRGWHRETWADIHGRGFNSITRLISFTKNGSNRRSILSVYGPWTRATELN
jgi:hypothetical protein